MRNIWTEEQLALLRQVYHTSLPLSEIGDLVKHSAGSVRAKAGSLGLVRKPDIWTPEHEAELATLWAGNVPIVEVARRVGHLVKDVEHKVFQLGLRRGDSSARSIRTGTVSHPRPGVLVHKSGI